MYRRGYRPLEAAKGVGLAADRGGDGPKPEGRNRKAETGNDERDDPNWVLRRRRERNRLWSPKCERHGSAQRLFRKAQDVSGRCHKDFDLASVVDVPICQFFEELAFL